MRSIYIDLAQSPAEMKGSRGSVAAALFGPSLVLAQTIPRWRYNAQCSLQFALAMVVVERGRGSDPSSQFHALFSTDTAPSPVSVNLVPATIPVLAKHTTLVSWRGTGLLQDKPYALISYSVPQPSPTTASHLRITSGIVVPLVVLEYPTPPPRRRCRAHRSRTACRR